MILTIAEDWTNTVNLDSELTSTPDSGMYLNSGVHPSITVDNLLSFLPDIEFTFDSWAVGTTYGEYTTTRSKGDIVDYNGTLYQSLVASNVGNQPDISPTQWLETNIESIRIKSFYLHSENNAIKKLNLTKRLIDNQYLYNVAELRENPTEQELPNDFAGWVFEPKGSDYVKIRINQIAFQAKTATPQSLYVVNQGQLITTLTLNPNADGRLVFEDVDYTFYGKGKFYFVVESQTVLTNGSSVDPLKFKGFVAYTCSGTGASAETATYSFGVSNNGLNFNISAHLDAQVYLDNNLEDFGSYVQAAWELDVLNMFLHNVNARSNRKERQVIDQSLLIAETKELNAHSTLKKFNDERNEAIKILRNTLDTELTNQDEEGEIEVFIGSI